VTSSDVAALIKDSVDILDVIGQVVPLRRVGNHHKGLCPFHQEKTPSFTVHPDKGFYHCFGCGAGGDVISFTMKHWNLAFAEAIAYLAERYHIALPRMSGDAPGTGSEARELREIVAVAADFFHHQLQHSAQGAEARRYAESRALPAELLEQRKLGFAPAGWDQLLAHLRRSKISPDLGVRAGLLVQSPKGKIYDRFRNRLMFPIRDPQGRLVAFGGRSLDGSEPKYLNSPETPIYHKGRTLYGYPEAREACRGQRQVVLVEGYMDLLAFHVHQFQRVTATLGTALTLAQVRLLRRIADAALLVYDADEAGQRAMFRALPLFLQEQLPVSRIALPVGKDPDDFLKARGLPAFLELVEARQDLGLCLVQEKLSGWDGTVADKNRVLRELAPLFQELRQPVVYAQYLQVVAERLAVSEAVVRRQLQPPQALVGGSGRGPRTPSMQDCHVAPAEETLVRLLIQQPGLVSELDPSSLCAQFEDTPLRNIVQVLTAQAPTIEEEPLRQRIYDLLPDDISKTLFARLALEEACAGDLETARVMLTDRLGTLRERRVKRHRQELQADLKAAEQQGDSARIAELMKQLQTLQAARNCLEADPTADDLSGR